MKISGIETKALLSKDEEIKILATLHEAFKGTGNYLEGLFTSEMVSHCSQSIRNDIAPDLFSECANNGSKILDLEFQLGKAKTELVRSEAGRDVVQRLADARLDEIHKISRKAQRPIELLVKLTEALTEAQEMCKAGVI